ncbi:DUF6165 family protein [Wenxinia marina]|uniref:Uncharacterized protein n=1 Tax=Wenxinia marina DSM 24838 TaxID=1123501 RepID=A0A0D0QK98_9RHOB|nr:DUF6165 family protein [Wenxinia marina]KIQ71433.1 hypothetical protein Wenmar_04081 [Wenxinia marina DSM 24838]GGL78961.1 hypothetical protein GCM10011392_36830 [Wenxinia marina]
MIIHAPISVGELFDKITILRVKNERLRDPERRAHVAHELALLEELAAGKVEVTDEIRGLVDELQQVNAGLWDIEDGKRAAERTKTFDAAFIDLARQVYLQNDRRAAVKKRINLLTGSEVVEEKSYDETS